MKRDRSLRSSAHRPRWLLTVVLLPLLAAAPAVAVIAQPGPATFGEETSVTIVEVPVEVSRDGVPVAGLHAADFEVHAGEQRLPIVGFEAVQLGAGAAAAAPAPSTGPPLAARRHVLLLFDLAFTRRERLRDALGAARSLLAGGLDPADLVAVATYVPRGELALLLSFTSDRSAAGRVLDAIDRAAEADGSEPALGDQGGDDPLRLTGAGARALIAKSWPLDERNMPAETLLSLGQLDSTRGSFLQHNALGHAGRLEQPNVDERMRGHIRAFNDTMSSLVGALRDVQGRKYLALFSEGFAGRLLTDGPRSASDPSFGGSNVLKPLGVTLEELRRSGWVVHAVDLAGLRRGSLAADGLFYLAHETGGTLVEGTNDLAKGLGEALRSSAHVYVLTVQADGVAADGAYHPLAVRLRDGTRGRRLRHRQGFYAPLPFGQRPAARRLAEAAMLVTSGEPRDELAIEVAAIPLGNRGPSRRFGVVVEVPGAALRGEGVGRPGLEAYGYALDEAGKSSDFFSYAVDLGAGNLAAPAAAAGVRFVAELDLPARPHRLRLLVRERSDGRTSLLSLPLDDAGGAGGDAALGEAVLFLPGAGLQGAEPWLVVREPSTSFELHGRPLSPSLHVAVPGGAEVPVAFVGDHLAGQRSALSARILDAGGRAVRGGTLELLSFTPGSSGQPDLLLGRLRVGTLAAGDYRLELAVAVSGTPRRSVVGRFRVVATPGRS